MTDALDEPPSAEAAVIPVMLYPLPLTRVNVVEELRVSLPIAPMRSSLGCVVIAVGPAEGAVLVVPGEVAVLSTGEAESKPLKYEALAAFTAGTVAEKVTVMALPEFN